MIAPIIIFFVEIAIMSLGGTYSESTNMESVSLLILTINVLVMLASIAGSHSIKRTMKLVLILSFLFRVALLLWDFYGRSVFVLPNSEADADAFHQVALSYAFGSRQGNFDWNIYPFYIGKLYHLIGVQRITAQYFNLMLSIIALYFTNRCMQLMKIKREVNDTLMGILAFLPNFAIICVLLLRESIIIFGIIISVFFFMKWWNDPKFRYIPLSLLFSLIATVFHSGSIAITASLAFLFVMFNGKQHSFDLTAKSIVYIVVFILLFTAVFSVYGDQLLGKFSRVETVQDVEKVTKYYEEGGASYSLDIVSSDSVLGIVVNTPLRILAFLVSPLPWKWRGVNDIIAFFFSALFYIITVYTAFAAVKSYRILKKAPGYRSHNTLSELEKEHKNLLFAFCIIIIMALIIFGWGTSNAGSALRHREKFTLVFGLLLAVSVNFLHEVKEKLPEKHKKKNHFKIRFGNFL